MTERWLPVVDWEDFYEVSSLARVRSLDRVIECRNGIPARWKGRVLKQQPSVRGYLTVILRRPGHKEHRQVHRLVALAFIPNPEAKSQVNHLDLNKQNNVLSNLEWATPMENSHHAIRLGVSPPPPLCQGERSGMSKLTDALVTSLREKYRAGTCFEVLAAEIGVSTSTVRRAVKGIGWGHLPGAFHGDGRALAKRGQKRRVLPIAVYARGEA